MAQEVIEWFSEALKWVVGLGGSIIAIRQWLIKPLKEMQEAQKQTNGELSDRVEKIEKKIATIQDDVADSLGDRLGQAYRHFMAQKWCTYEEKRYFVELHKRYSERGHNHLADTYEQDLVALPEHPPAEEEVR